MLKTKERKSSGKTEEESMSNEQLQLAAYFHWLDRGCPENDALTDWVEVEKKDGKASWIAGEGDD